jgi:hypothetical protein
VLVLLARLEDDEDVVALARPEDDEDVVALARPEDDEDVVALACLEDDEDVVALARPEDVEDVVATLFAIRARAGRPVGAASMSRVDGGRSIASRSLISCSVKLPPRR